MGRDRRENQAARRVAVVGLTGGIGAGKSTALSMFAALGAETLSADETVHGLYEQPEVVYALSVRFGFEVLDDSGAVDRGRLAAAVRGEPERLKWLEGLTHPLVEEEIERRVAAAPDCSVLVCEVPLLFDAGYERLFDVVVTVEADPEVRRKRSTHDFGPEQFQEFETLQASRERRTAGSDFTFINDGPSAALRGFVEDVHRSVRSSLRQAGCGDGS